MTSTRGRSAWGGVRKLPLGRFQARYCVDGTWFKARPPSARSGRLRASLRTPAPIVPRRPPKGRPAQAGDPRRRRDPRRSPSPSGESAREAAGRSRRPAQHQNQRPVEDPLPLDEGRTRRCHDHRLPLRGAEMPTTIAPIHPGESPTRGLPGAARGHPTPSGGLDRRSSAPDQRDRPRQAPDQRGHCTSARTVLRHK